MKAVDLRDARRNNPDREFAVAIPFLPWGPTGGRSGSIIVRAIIEDYKDNTAYVIVPEQVVGTVGAIKQPRAEFRVPYASVRATWESHVYELAHTEALRDDLRRDQQIEWQRKRAERIAWIEGFLPAFEGIALPAGGTVADELRDYFIKHESQTITCRAEVFEAIAERLR